MSTDPIFLREDVYFEPLFNHWYAWPYLIPPVTAARHVVNTHRRIMSSFVNNAHLHMLATLEKDLAGGEYLNCAPEDVPKIQRLIQEIDERCADLVKLSSAVAELDELLRSHTSGESVEPLYGAVPAPLRGLVELFLDIEHRPSFRIIEPLVYGSELYRKSLQSLSFGSLANVEQRPFVFSTPRLPDEQHLQVNLEFDHPAVDRIFATREHPADREEMYALFKDHNLSGGLSYEELFTEKAPRIRHSPVEEGVRLTFTGHAGFLVETNDAVIQIDPVIASRRSPDQSEVFSFSEIPPEIDYICLTHNHQDHANIESLLQLRYKTKNILVPKNNGGTLVDPSLRLILRQLAFNAREVDDLESVSVPGGRIVAIPFLGEHGDLNIRSKTAWYVELLGKKLLFCADSSNLDNQLYVRLAEIFGELDVLAIGMECVGAPYTWLYGALNTRLVSKSIKNSRRLNGCDCAQALPLVQSFNPKQVFIYALGQEPWYKYFTGLEYDDDSRQLLESRKMIDGCRSLGIEARTLFGREEIRFG